MTAVKRRLELLKLEGLGFSMPEIVTELSQKYGCSGRTVYRDFESRGRWQPELQNVRNHFQILMRTVNRYEQIYINLEQAIFSLGDNSEYTTRIAKTVRGARVLLEAGFEYVTDMDGYKLFRKRK